MRFYARSPPHENPEDVIARVVRVVTETQKLPPGKVTAGSSFEELGIDSLDGINIIFGLESEFNVNIDDEQARQVRDVQGLADGIEKLLGGAEPLSAGELS